MIKVPNLISESDFLTMSTCSCNVPWISTLFFWTDTNRNFYFVSRRDSEHVRNIVVNNKVSFAISNIIEKQGIQVSGAAEIITDEGELRNIIKLGGKKLSLEVTDEMVNGKILQYMKADRVVVKISIDKCYINMWNEGEGYDYRVECRIAGDLLLGVHSG
jgi:nitroimidazol reductase NimA-like FMN-containing flavoprotein (pyridoxamine 5'-phosphate oxidase superfamily)